MQNVRLLVLTVLGTLFLVFGASWWLSQLTKPALPGANGSIDAAVLLGEAPHEKGVGAGAPVTVVEFSDFQCPACAATAPQVKLLLSQYQDRVRFVYRHFPLTNIHRNAFSAAQAAEAAALQGKFWEMHDELFASQNTWKDMENPATHYLSVAQKIGLDVAKFQADLIAPASKEAVNEDLRTAEKLQIQATPTFFVNGVPMTLDKVEAALKAATPVAPQNTASASAMPAASNAGTLKK